jgi:hypothetical protein
MITLTMSKNQEESFRHIKFPSNGDYKKLIKQLYDSQQSLPFQIFALECAETASTIYLRSSREVGIYVDAVLMCWQVRPKER